MAEEPGAGKPHAGIREGAPRETGRSTSIPPVSRQVAKQGPHRGTGRDEPLRDGRE